MEKLVAMVYGSDQTHCALQKAVQIAGIHTKNFRAMKSTKSNSFGLCPNSLRATIHADVEAGLVPFFLCATVGTTSTNGFMLKWLKILTYGFMLMLHMLEVLAFAQSFVISLMGLRVQTRIL